MNSSHHENPTVRPLYSGTISHSISVVEALSLKGEHGVLRVYIVIRTHIGSTRKKRGNTKACVAKLKRKKARDKRYTSHSKNEYPEHDLTVCISSDTSSIHTLIGAFKSPEVGGRNGRVQSLVISAHKPTSISICFGFLVGNIYLSKILITGKPQVVYLALYSATRKDNISPPAAGHGGFPSPCP